VHYTTGDEVRSSPTVANGVVYFGSDDYNLYALNATTGAKLWNYTTGGEVHYTTGDEVRSSPTVANGVVYFGSDDYNLYALNATTGAKLWNYTTGGEVRSSPAIANGVVYFGSGTKRPGDTSSTPGFEVAFAVIGLAIVAYVARKKR
jgi:eukaryotic-like serine/threonine-protein kinase